MRVRPTTSRIPAFVLRRAARGGVLGLPRVSWSVVETEPCSVRRYQIDADGHNKARLTNSPDVDVAPSWVAR